tara:strand:- start:8171 stop:8344 length:174 start_codon:yes stop_codon:yes gene_type:complete
MHHYTVGWHDNQQHHFEICEYAEDSFHALKQAKEDIPSFKNSHMAEYCIKEDDIKTT